MKKRGPSPAPAVISPAQARVFTKSFNGIRGWKQTKIHLCTQISTMGHPLPSGKRLHNYGKSPFLMGKSTISMAIFNSLLYVYPWTSFENDGNHRDFTEHDDVFSMDFIPEDHLIWKVINDTG